MAICPKGHEIEIEMSDYGFYMIAYCQECDADYDPRPLLSEESLRNIAELGIAPAHPDYLRGRK